MELECYPTAERPPEIVPGRPQRAWMDHFAERHPYRCLPLAMANTTGWEILCPMAFTAEWNGGVMQDDITLTADRPHPDFHNFVKSHFSHGVVTFHPGYLFRTPPGWSMVAQGPPNHVKDGVQPPGTSTVIEPPVNGSARAGRQKAVNAIKIQRNTAAFFMSHAPSFCFSWSTPRRTLRNAGLSQRFTKLLVHFARAAHDPIAK